MSQKGEHKMKATGLQHIGIPVVDSEKTVAFYESLGFKVALDTMNGSEHVVFLKLGNLVIETYQNGQATLQSGAWDHVCIDVEDIEEAWEEVVVKLGNKSIEGKIMYLPFWEKGVKFFTILGPNKEKVEFGQIL